MEGWREGGGEEGEEVHLHVDQDVQTGAGLKKGGSEWEGPLIGL